MTLSTSGQHSDTTLGWQAAHDVHALDMLLPEAAIYVVERHVDFARLYVLHQPRSLLRHAKSKLIASIRAPTDRSTGIICDRPFPGRLGDYPELLRRIRSRTPSPARPWSSSPTTSRFRPPPSARSTKAAGRRNSSSSGSSSIFGSSVLRHVGERGEDADLEPSGLRPRKTIVKKRSTRMPPSLYTLLRSSRFSGPSSRKCPYIKHLRETPGATLRK